MWAADIARSKENSFEKYVTWLHKPYHLSEALKRVCSVLTVEILYQGQGVFLADERAILNVHSFADCCYVRQVFLVGDVEQRFCFARIVAPLETYHHYREAFDALNNQLIGNTLLYANSKTTRSPFEYAVLDETHLIYQLLFKELFSPPPLSQGFPARRSVFYMDGTFPLLVTEVFLKSLPEYVS